MTVAGKRRPGYRTVLRQPPLAPRPLTSVALPWVPAATGPVGAVTFPTAPLSAKVFIALGADLTQSPTSWSWTDITSYVRFVSGISTRQGREDWTSTVRTSSAQLTLDNRDGRFSRRNPTGPYYGQLTFNTPIWMTIDPGSGPVTRFTGFVNEWPTRWSDRSGTDSAVPIQCAGIMRRLQQGSVLKSAMRRAVLSKAQPVPIAYWPFEDGTDATSVASGLANGLPMTGSPVFGAAFGGSTGSLDFATTGPFALTANVPISSSGCQIEYIGQSPSGSTIGVASIISGTFSALLSFNSALADGNPHHVAVSLVQDGSNVDVSSYRDGVLSSTTPIAGVLSTTVQISLPQGAGSVFLLAHMAVYDFANISDPSRRASAASAYAGEFATARIRRLAAEEGVPMVCTSGLSPAMGAQPVDTFLNILRDCETVDQGVLYETNWGLGYQSTNDRCNQLVSLALDFNQRHIAVEPEPADDDQRLRNRWTVNRSSGSGYTKEQTSGPLGTQAGGPGLYDDSATVNVQADTQLGDQAGWRLHFGVVDEDRWPSIAIRLHGTPDLIPSWATMPFGARMTAANPTTQAPQVAPDTIDTIVEGWSERWDPESWEAVLNTSPYSPYQVGTLAADTGDTSSTLLILTPDTLTLAAAVDTTATSWSINSSPLWTTNTESFPRRIMWEGEELSLTLCTAALLDAFGRTSSSSWGSADIGGSYNISGGTGTDYNVASGLGTILMPSANVAHNAVLGSGYVTFDGTVSFKTGVGVFATGAPLLAALVTAWADTDNAYHFRAQLETSGAVTALVIRRSGASETIIASARVPALSWSSDVLHTIRGQLTGSTLQMKVWPASGTEPDGWHASGTDSLALLPAGAAGVSTMRAVGNTNVNPVISFDNLAITPTQIWTVTRSVNGVAKSHAAGSTGRILRPGVLGLA